MTLHFIRIKTNYSSKTASYYYNSLSCYCGYFSYFSEFSLNTEIQIWFLERKGLLKVIDKKPHFENYLKERYWYKNDDQYDTYEEYLMAKFI